jgi:hypothetical protein
MVDPAHLTESEIVRLDECRTPQMPDALAERFGYDRRTSLGG